MIFFDTTKSGSSRHRSGLTRVSSRLLEEWPGVKTVSWKSWDRAATAQDWYFTPELFSDAERPGWSAWLASPSCRRAAIFHDAIPLKFPHITWPQSVGRHASYLKELALFDHVFAVSEASRQELLEFWTWQGVKPRGDVSVVALGADGLKQPRPAAFIDAPSPHMLVVGILEPRKNQLHALRVAEALWSQGVTSTMHLVGRVNPHFGRSIVQEIRAVQRRWPGRLFFHEALADAALIKLTARSRVTLFPTLAEGCGLPVLESLWAGVPCVCNDLPVLRENADAGGCLSLPVADLSAWVDAVRGVLTDETQWRILASAALARPLPTWSRTTATLRDRM